MDVIFFINDLVLFVQIGLLDYLLEFLVHLVFAEVEGELTFLQGGLPLVEVDLLAAEGGYFLGDVLFCSGQLLLPVHN
jgi:hypothetical protein